MFKKPFHPFFFARPTAASSTGVPSGVSVQVLIGGWTSSPALPLFTRELHFGELHFGLE